MSSVHEMAQLHVAGERRPAEAWVGFNSDWEFARLSGMSGPYDVWFYLGVILLRLIGILKLAFILFLKLCRNLCTSTWNPYEGQ